MATANDFIIYNASAGSGKTYTLVKEYLALLLQGDQNDVYRNILAITFTNKAVAEMKSRVISSLNNLAQEDCPVESRSMLDDLVTQTGKPASTLRNKAQAVLKSILHNYASFDISTIDRFTHKIIRTFAKDLGLPVNFEVEMQTLDILREAIDRLINKAGEDKDLTRVLVKFTITKTDDDKSWDISRDLFNFSQILLKESHQLYINSIKDLSLEEYSRYGEKIKKQITAIEEDLLKIAESFFSIVEEEGLEKSNFNRGSVFDYFSKIKDQNFRITFGSKWQENIEDDKLYAAKVPSPIKDILDRYQPEIALLFKASKAAIFRREYLKEIFSNITPLSLLSLIAKEVETIKQERALVLISDFNPTIAAQVKDQPAPFIYERLGERYRNYFIDEFQDTSQMQWNNIIPLIDHALSQEVQQGQASGLTLVGDAKQSIYRFRGGKAEQFIALYNDENPFGVQKKVSNLPYNFRSAREIVEFNNSFFLFVANTFQQPIYRELFEQSKQIPKKDTTGYINISFLETENVEEEMEMHPSRVLEIIRELEVQNVNKSDICILTRTRKQSFAIANHLAQEGISIVSSESLLVSNSAEVEFVNQVLEFSINPTDKNIRWNILNYLVNRNGITQPHRIISENLELEEEKFFSWLENFNINFDLQQVREYSLYEAAEYIINCFSLIETSDAYLQFYLDFIFEKTSKKPAGVSTFLEIWEQNKEKLSIVAPQTNDAVQIMTIHKSKGLEFPVVIFPFANGKLRDVSKEHLWLPLPEELAEIPYGYFKASQKMLNWGPYEATAYEELLHQAEFDAINILYVAFTRASRQLYILSCLDLKKGQEYGDKVSGLLIGYLKSTNLWTEEATSEIGSKENFSSKKISVSSQQPGQYFSSPIRGEKVKLVTRAGSLWDSSREEALKTGIMVHDILSEIDSRDDVSRAISKYVKKGVLDAAEEKILQQKIFEVIEHPEVAPYFSGKDVVYRERDILNPAGETIRPDRLNINGHKVTILDYKTGKFSPAHQVQMENYAGVLVNMGYEIDKKLLIYINEDVKITFV